MTKKSFTTLAIILVITISISFNLVLAKNISTDSEQAESNIPEQDGIYDVPGHPDLKVRVFVHNVKPGKPTPPAPSLQCELNDPDSLAVVSGAGWKLPANFTYNLNPNNVPALVGSVNWPLIAENSFNVWENEISKKADVNRGINTTVSRKGLDGKNIVAWGSASASTLGVTYIWYNPATMGVRELDTILNKKFVWTWSNGSSTCAYENSYDAQNILTHEIGHWFGLDDHYTEDYFNNTMYGYGFKMDAKGDTLTSGDILGVQAIY
jgi:hypothetical protein